jgi:rubrerythrin
VNLTTFLDSLETLENEMAGLYGALADRFEASDAEASGLFFQLAMQERNHANLVRFARGLVRRTPERFAEAPTDDRDVQRLVERVRGFRAAVDEPTLEEAVGFALDVEGDPLEQLHRKVVEWSDSEVGRVMAQLASDDRGHHERLGEFAGRRGLELPGSG